MLRRIIWLASILFFLSSSSCGAFSNPREKFIDDLENKYEKLISLLEGSKEDIYNTGDRIIAYSKDGELVGRKVSGAIMPPDSWASHVVSEAKEIRNHFEMVTLKLLKHDVINFEEWGGRLKEKYNENYVLVVKLIENINREFIRDPNKYGTLNLLGPNLVRSEYTVYFNDGSNLYKIQDIIKIDIDKWLAIIKEKSIEIQKHL